MARYSIDTNRGTTMLLIYLFGWVVHFYPWWMIDTEHFKPFGVWKWEKQTMLTLHIGLFGIAIHGYEPSAERRSKTPRFRCRRCRTIVTDKGCNCATSPSPWEPI